MAEGLLLYNCALDEVGEFATDNVIAGGYTAVLFAEYFFFVGSAGHRVELKGACEHIAQGGLVVKLFAYILQQHGL